MATTSLTFNTEWGLGDAWTNKTTYNVSNSDNNSFYVGRDSGKNYRSRLTFTIPSNTNATSLVIGFLPVGTATLSYMKCHLTTSNVTSDADVWASSASILASSYFYSDKACTKQVTGITSSWIYAKFNYTFVAGKTYYIGIFPYSSSSAAVGDTTYTGIWLASRNMANYILGELTYTTTSYTVTYNANGGTGTMANSTAIYNSAFITRKNAFTKDGYAFNGWNEKADGTGNVWSLTSAGVYESGKSWTWTYTKNITLYAQWKQGAYTDRISGWIFGFKNKEGNNSDKSSYWLGYTNFANSYKSGDTVTPVKSDGMEAPSGFMLKQWASSISGTWVTYSFGDSFTQPASNVSVEYNYYPINYTITYDLNGGTNNTNNPSTYNVLYGVMFSAPTKAGYKFAGWTINGGAVTGINPGANATFMDVDDLYAKLSERTIGNVTVTANWKQCDATLKVFDGSQWLICCTNLTSK